MNRPNLVNFLIKCSFVHTGAMAFIYLKIIAPNNMLPQFKKFNLTNQWIQNKTGLQVYKDSQTKLF